MRAILFNLTDHRVFREDDHRMQEYEVKRGLAKKNDLQQLLTAAFGSAKKDGEWTATSFGAMPVIKAKYTPAGTLVVDTESKKELAAAVAKGDKAALDLTLDTSKRWNEFLLQATGYDTKTRGKKAQEKAKKAAA